MNCADLEILICDYVDGTLAPAEKAEVERHFAQCPACAELARDSAAAVGFMERAAAVEPPPELITRILFDAPWSTGKSKTKQRGWLGKLLAPVLQPRFAMGMAMTILSISMLARFIGVPRELRPADFEPAKIWAGMEDRAVRTWARTVKFYDNLKFVYQIQTTLRQWQQQDTEQRPVPKTDERKLPTKAPVPSGAPASNTPSPNGGGGSR
ncbi:MAG TPA: zf-HC2 domain-containing protein [Bryobacteraceae bacterium]|jgi:hypothetical protein